MSDIDLENECPKCGSPPQRNIGSDGSDDMLGEQRRCSGRDADGGCSISWFPSKEAEYRAAGWI